MSNLRTAAQQALEALEYDTEPEPKYGINAAITTLRAALAEPVQEAEPVAWRWGYRSVTTGEMDWRGYVEIAAHPNLRSPEIIMEPLYTAPPPPQRKPLTEEEIQAALAEPEPCQYPDCVDNGPEGKCIRWLVGECEGPKIGLQP